MRIPPCFQRLLLPAFFLFTSLLVAQPDQRAFGPIGQVYSLTNEEAAALFRSNKPLPYRESWLHTLVDTFHGADPRRPLPPGHYLLVNAVEERIELETRLVNSIQVWLLPNRRDFDVVVTDSSHRAIRDARVLLRSRLAPYDTARQCYHLPRRSKSGFVEVYTQGESWFGEIKNEFRKPLWIRWLGYHSSYGAGRVLATPVRYGRFAFIRLKSLLQGYGWNRRRYRSDQFAGYIALSQPKYQPGDTLRVKAYVASRKGRPWNRPLELEIRGQSSPHQRILRRDIMPLTPGAFVFEMPLGDTLRLDRRYSVTFTEKVRNANREERSIGEWFRLEDYQLDEVRYTLKSEQPEFRHGEPIVLQLSARDANEIPVPDASLKLVLITESPIDFHAPEVLVPDTLWRHEQAFDPGAETAVEVPDSVWPEASLRVTAHAWCATSSGELQQKKTTFSVIRTPNPLKATIEDGFLRITRAGEARDSVLLAETQSDGRSVKYRNIRLPFQERLVPEVAEYAVKSGAQKITIPLPDAAAVVQKTAYRQGDSVFFALVNPYRLILRYQLYQGQHRVEEGILSDSLWVWQQPAKAEQSYGLSYQFVWAGETHRFHSEALFYKNLLNIRLEQPGAVQPGQQVQVKIRVADARNRPVSGVNLTAGAYNRQFEDNPPYSTPDIVYQRMRWPFPYHNFKLEAAEKKTFITPVTQSWYERLQLDSVLYYRLRFRGEGCYTESYPIREQLTDLPAENPEGYHRGMPFESDSFYQRRPQFAPHLIRGNQAQPIYLIYCNKQLVYYYGATSWQRYSFYGWYGYNQITIRTRNGEYTLDSVRLEAGQKLEIAFDGDCFRQIKAPFRVQYQPRPDTLTLFEQQTLKRTMLLWRPETSGYGHYFWNGPENIQVIPSNHGNRGLHILGPFYPNAPLYYLLSGKLFTSFTFEPGFEYRISAGRERLYESQWPRGATRLPKNAPARHPGDLAWGPHHILIKTKQVPAAPDFKGPGRDMPGKASLKLQFRQPDTLLAVLLKGDTLLGPFRPSTARLDEIPPGNYRLSVYSASGYLWQKDIRLRRDTLLYLDASRAIFRPAGPDETLEYLISKEEIDTAKQQENKLSSQFSQWPGVLAGTNGFEGVLTDENGEPLIGATVIFEQGGIPVGGTITDFNGFYQIHLPPGIYDIRFSYTGFTSETLTGVQAYGQGMVPVNRQLAEGQYLQEVVVTGYGVPLIQQDYTSSAAALTSEQIRNLPTRSVHAITAATAGVAMGADSFNYDQYLNPYRGNVFRAKLIDGQEEAPARPILRSQFHDYAYWQPNLLTDPNGEAWFTATFPDNITSWNSFVLGMDRRKRAGVATQNTRAFKPLLAKLALPRFAVAGDRFDAAGLTTNLGADSAEVATAFRLDGHLLRENRARIGKALVEFARVQVPVSGADSIHLSYEMQSAAGSDGEKRGIAILPAGTRETSGQFLLLDRDSTLSLPFDPALGPVTVQAVDNALDLLSEDIQYLRNYPFGCNEQTASRLLGLLAEKTIPALPQKAPRPDAKQTAKNKALLEKEINACLKRLREGQLADGSWGWWADGTPNVWMTTYVLRALLEAKRAGYPGDGCEKGLIFLRHEAPGLYPHEQADVLLLLREADVNFDCSPYLARLDTLPKWTLQEKFSHWRLQQRCGRELPIDSLRNYLHPTITGGLYAGEESTHWYNRRANTTLLAYDIAREAGWTDITRGIRNYWFESRPAAQRQRNTIETAQLIRRLLPEFLTGTDSLRANRLDINGVHADTFSQKWILPAGTQAVSLRKSGNTPLYLSAYQQWLNPAPAPRSDLFEVHSWLEQGGHRVDSLEQSMAAELIIVVQVYQSADYVMIDVPVPAGCSYGEKPPVRRPEVHREYFRDRTVLFCESLPVGRYEFRIPLEPRFTGQFTLNPVRVEQMYFPVFYGRNTIGQVLISKN